MNCFTAVGRVPPLPGPCEADAAAAVPQVRVCMGERVMMFTR